MKLMIRVLLLCLLAGMATAEEEGGSKPYVSVRGAMARQGDVTALQETADREGGYAIGGAVGFSMNDYLMFDLFSVDYMSGEFVNSDISTLNIITELRAGLFGGEYPVKPYLAVGVGASRAKFEFANSPYPNIDAWGLAWSVGGGVDYALADTGFSVGLFYRYRNSVALANNWHPIPPTPGMSEEDQFIYYSEWKVSYHAIGIELRFGGNR